MKLFTIFAFTAVTVNQAAELKPYERIQKEMDFEGFTEGDWVQMWSTIAEMMPEDNKIGFRSGSQAVFSARQQMTRYIQLKYALMFLLRNQNSFTKFCNYGCWCLPEDSGTVGYGKPVDAIDAACKEYTTCFNCVHKQESCDEELYKMTGKMDNGERYLLCMDPIGSCKRNRCECDLELAKKIAGREKVWNASYHREFGESPSADMCRVGANSQINNDARIDVGLFEGDFVEQSDDSSLSFKDALKLGDVIGCCGSAPKLKQFRRGQKCCPDGQVMLEGVPCDIDFS